MKRARRAGTMTAGSLFGAFMIAMLAVFGQIGAAVAQSDSDAGPGLSMHVVLLPGAANEQQCAAALRGQVWSTPNPPNGTLSTSLEVIRASLVTRCIAITNEASSAATDVSLLDLASGIRTAIGDLQPGQQVVATWAVTTTSDQEIRTLVQGTAAGRSIEAELVARVFVVDPAIIHGVVTLTPKGLDGLAGALVELSGFDRSGASVSQTIRTGQSGQFQFDGLSPSEPGGYVVQLVESAGTQSAGLETTLSGSTLSGSTGSESSSLRRRRVSVAAGDVTAAPIVVQPNPALTLANRRAIGSSVQPAKTQASASQGPGPHAHVSGALAFVDATPATSLLPALGLWLSFLVVLAALLSSALGADRRQPRCHPRP